MGLPDQKCDSCGDEHDVLFPVGILDELPSGGMAMVQRWYCVTCLDQLKEEAEEADDDDVPVTPEDDSEGD